MPEASAVADRTERSGGDPGGYRSRADDRTQPSIGELFDTIVSDSRSTEPSRIYHQAYKQGQTVTQFLNRHMPENDRSGLDGFQTMMRKADVITQGVPEEGIWADTFGRFLDAPGGRTLIPEWAARIGRRIRYARPPQERLLYTSDQFPLGNLERPYVDAAQARYFQLMPAIPLSEVVAMTTPIDGDAYRAFYLTNDTTGASYRMYRVSEGAELPRARLTGGDHIIRLYKYGRGLEMTYEDLRRQRIDLVALHISRIALQTEIDKLAAVISVMVNGDGNSNSATVYNLSALDPNAVVGNLSLAGWLAFKLKFINPYAISTVLAQDNIVSQLYQLNTGTANIPLMVLDGGRNTFGSLNAINPGLADGVRIGHTPAAPSQEIIGFDNRWNVERVTELGSDITEVEKFASRQTTLLTISEVEGYAVFDAFACKILNVNA